MILNFLRKNLGTSYSGKVLFDRVSEAGLENDRTGYSELIFISAMEELVFKGFIAETPGRLGSLYSIVL